MNSKHNLVHYKIQKWITDACIVRTVPPEQERTVAGIIKPVRKCCTIPLTAKYSPQNQKPQWTLMSSKIRSSSIIKCGVISRVSF